MTRLAGLLCLWALAALMLAEVAVADSLETTDGRKFQGRLISNGPDKVTFEIRSGSSTMTMEFAPNKVAKVVQDPSTIPTPAPSPAPTSKATSAPTSEPASQPTTQSGNTYFVIPIRDEIGLFVTADQVQQSLKIAEKLKPSVIILEIDSPGGSTDECRKILTVLSKYQKDFRVVAYVKKAISAAAVITMSCKEIYVDERAVFGGALAFRMTPMGTPAAINEKMQSLWRATCRSAADAGEHQSLLVEAMVDQDLELSIVTKDGKPAVAEGSSGTMLKRKGKLLTMTAKESVDCGLAKGKANDYDALAVKLEMSGWKSAGKEGENLYERYHKEMDSTVTKLKQLNKSFKEQIDKANRAKTRQEAAGALDGAVSSLRQALELAKKYPQFGITEEDVTDMIRELTNQKEAIKGK